MTSKSGGTTYRNQKFAMTNIAWSKIGPKNMKEKPRQPVNATIPEQKSQTKMIEQPE